MTAMFTLYVQVARLTRLQIVILTVLQTFQVSLWRDLDQTTHEVHVLLCMCNFDQTLSYGLLLSIHAVSDFHHSAIYHSELHFCHNWYHLLQS